MTDPNLPAEPRPVDRLTLFGIPTSLSTQQQAQIRTLITVVATVAGTLGFISTTGAVDFTNKLMDLGGAVSGILTAIAGAVVAFNQIVVWWKTSREEAIKRVSNIPNTMVVKTTPTASDVHVATEISKIPGTVAVITDTATAIAAPSTKVVASPQ